MRHRPRTDANHSAIIKALREVGCSVVSLASLGRGVPDILCARNGMMWLIEIKDGNKPPGAQKLTADEQDWHERWQAPVYVVNSIEIALGLITNR